MSDTFDHAEQALDSQMNCELWGEDRSPSWGEEINSWARRAQGQRGHRQNYLAFFNRINPYDEFEIEEPEETNNIKTKENSAMNISYMQTVYDESIKTVGVVFDGNDIMAKRHVYKTRLDLKVGDICIVKIQDRLKAVEVAEIHEEPAIDPYDNLDYKWITQKVDIDSIEAAEAEDKAAAVKVRKHIRAKARRQAQIELAETYGEEFQLGSSEVDSSIDETDV